MTAKKKAKKTLVQDMAVPKNIVATIRVAGNSTGPPAKKRKIGTGEPCPGCHSVDTFVRSTRGSHPAAVTRIRFHKCNECRATFKTFKA